MTVREIILMVYPKLDENKNHKRWADGLISKYCLMMGITIGLDSLIELSDALIMVANMSNPTKRNNVMKSIRALYEDTNTNLENNTSSDNGKIFVEEYNYIRNETYKKVCRRYHPDNMDTGNEDTFKLVQDIKFIFWDWDGTPRDVVGYAPWVDTSGSLNDVLRRRRDRREAKEGYTSRTETTSTFKNEEPLF